MMKMVKLISLLPMIIAGASSIFGTAQAQDEVDPVVAMLDDLNEKLAGEPYKISSVSLLADEDHAEMGRTVIASDRGNKQIPVQYLPGDERRVWGDTVGTGITWAMDGTEAITASGLSASDTEAAITAAMKTWDDVQCSDIGLIGKGSAPFDLGYVQWLFGLGGIPGILADITHGGFLPAAFFDRVRPGGARFILAVTFTFYWISDSRTAFTEIYYNDRFTWKTDGGNIDVQTVALHEAGHGLSQAHFGDIFRTPGGKLKFAPRAVMNAAYSKVQREIDGTDLAGHCSIWGSWPNGDGAN